MRIKERYEFAAELRDRYWTPSACPRATTASTRFGFCVVGDAGCGRSPPARQRRHGTPHPWTLPNNPPLPPLSFRVTRISTSWVSTRSRSNRLSTQSSPISRSDSMCGYPSPEVDCLDRRQDPARSHSVGPDAGHCRLPGSRRHDFGPRAARTDSSTNAGSTHCTGSMMWNE